MGSMNVKKKKKNAGIPYLYKTIVCWWLLH